MLKKMKFFIKFTLLIFSLLFHAFGVKSTKSLPKSVSQRFSPMFSSKCFIVLQFIFRCMIYFELIFHIKCKVWTKIYFFICRYVPNCSRIACACVSVCFHTCVFETKRRTCLLLLAKWNLTLFGQE